MTLDSPLASLLYNSSSIAFLFILLDPRFIISREGYWHLYFIGFLFFILRSYPLSGGLLAKRMAKEILLFPLDLCLCLRFSQPQDNMKLLALAVPPTQGSILLEAIS